MAQVKINQVDSNISVTDAQSLLSPEILDTIAEAVSQKIELKQQLKQLSQDDRSLNEAAVR